MRARQDALTLAGALLALSAQGCGAIFHSSQRVAVVPRTQDNARVYADGVPAPRAKDGSYEITVSSIAGGARNVVAVAPGKRIKRVVLEKHVDAVTVVCDVLWSLTIVGIAAPISDALLGTFTKVPSTIEVQLEDDAKTPNPMPTYSVGGANVVGAELSPAASASPSASAAH